MKKIFISFFLVFAMFLSVSCNNLQGDGAYEDDSSTTECDSEATEQSDIKEETSSETDSEKSNESNTEEKIENEALKMVDFLVSVPADREPVILQLTDTQIIDPSQMRTSDRLGGLLPDYWGADKKDVRCYDYLREIITNTNPDLIIITGDIIYGEFDDNGSNMIEFVEFMESFNIPWAPIFGNHDNESAKGVDWQCKQFENAENCLFLQRELTGNGNYTVGIEQGGELTRVFFMLDSNGCGNASLQSLANGQTKQTIGFGSDQISWYTKNAKAITKESPKTKLSFAFHIQLEVFGDAFARYTSVSGNNVFIDYDKNKQDGDFGYIERHYEGFDADRSIWNGLKKLGVDSIFVGHEHANSASIVYEGVRLQFGMKSTAYDSLNYVNTTGEIEHTVYSSFTPWVGGSVFSLDDEGNIIDPYIYYCENGGAKIDWDSIYGEVEAPEYENAFDAVDFIVEVPEGREAVILQLTDPQIIDSSKSRTEDRLGSTHKDYWAADKKEERCYGYLREIITNTSPDLIIITGDIIYGEFDDDGDNMIEFVKFMESFNIPWAPVFGNHDNESKMGADWQSEQFEKAEHCLFLQRELTGNGNYTVGIKQGGELKRVFFMLDSNGCGNVSAESLANGHTVSYVGFGKDQIDWYTDTAKKITNVSPKTRFSAAWHIQPNVFLDALALYDTDGTAKVFIDYVENRRDSDFGYIGAKLKGEWDIDKSVFNGLKKLGFDSIFVGHEHQNSASIVYEGVRLQYGMKSSAYDRLNYIDGSGNIEGTYYSTDTPWVGGSVIKLSEADGSICDAYIYYCKEAGGDIDWDSFKPIADEPVNGLQKDTDFTMESGISVSGVKFDGTVNAYKVEAANQGKVKINVELLKNKSSFTFTVYVPSTSTEKLGALGEFAIRTKPNEIEPEGDGGSYIGYIDYNSTPHSEDYKIIFDTWQTFTVDISDFGEKCTEFAFVIASGNTIYLRDMVIE